MHCTSSLTIVYTFFFVVLARDPIKKFIRDGKEPVVGRDYMPTRWITNSAMDVWYGNKSMIDILWREFSDLMYKLTDRKFRSTRLEDFKPNITYENTSKPEDFNLNNNDSINNHNIYNNSINNENAFKNNLSLYDNDINDVNLNDNYLNNASTYNNNNVTNINVSEFLLEPIVLYPLDNTTFTDYT